MADHVLKVVPPYFERIADGTKTFEVRKNDRAYQRGDVLHLGEWHPEQTNSARRCPHEGCNFYESEFGHWSQAGGKTLVRVVTFVYAGDPRFGGIEPGHVVLALASPDTEGGADRMTHPHVVTVRAYLDNAGITPETLRYAATHEALCRSWIFDLLNGLADVMDDAPSPGTAADRSET